MVELRDTIDDMVVQKSTSELQIERLDKTLGPSLSALARKPALPAEARVPGYIPARLRSTLESSLQAGRNASRKAALPAAAQTPAARHAKLSPSAGSFAQEVQSDAIRELLWLPSKFREQFEGMMHNQRRALERQREQIQREALHSQRELKSQIAEAKRHAEVSRAEIIAAREEVRRLSHELEQLSSSYSQSPACESASRVITPSVEGVPSIESPSLEGHLAVGATGSSDEDFAAAIHVRADKSHSDPPDHYHADFIASSPRSSPSMSTGTSTICDDSISKESTPFQGRPPCLLANWINALLPMKLPYTVKDLHLAFADGHTLSLLLERLGCGPRKSKQAEPRVATVHRTLEHALNLVWMLNPNPSAMPTASQLFDASRHRTEALRFIDMLYVIFVVRPARRRLPAAARWLNGLLAPYQLQLPDSVTRPPHSAIGAELRSCVALAIMLNSCVPARRSELAGAVYWKPMNDAERQRSVHAVVSVLNRERLAPCTAAELLELGVDELLEEELLIIMLSAAYQRLGNVRASPSAPLLSFVESTQTAPWPSDQGEQREEVSTCTPLWAASTSGSPTASPPRTPTFMFSQSPLRWSATSAGASKLHKSSCGVRELPSGSEQTAALLAEVDAFLS